MGREDKTQTILFRSVRKALKAINGDWITDAQVDEARAAFEEKVYNYYYQLPDAA